MRTLLASKSAEVAQLCARHRVVRLSVFGSTARGSFKAGQSDVDLLVEFDPMPPAEHASHYFGLQEDLEALLSTPVDLIESKPIRNPFFRQAVETGKVLLFEAA